MAKKDKYNTAWRGRPEQPRALTPTEKIRIAGEFVLIVIAITFFTTLLNFTFDMSTFGGYFLNALILGASSPFLYIYVDQRVQKLQEK
ncbi:MAG: hypothetical protein Q6370_013585 [Candidatus Sigynarchaeota archaeon]